MPATATPFRFDGKNERAQRVAQRQAARMVQGVTRETEAAIRDVIVRSIRDGIPPYDAARLIEEMIGLDERRVGALLAYREGLINEGLAFGKVNALTDRYAAKLLRERAETIARTEIMAALNEGSMEGWRQAQANGLLSRLAVKEWITTPDERLCPNCAPMDGVQVPLKEPFKTPLGPAQHPPLHPRCLPGDALVASCGDIAAQSERRYDGDLLVIHTARGHRLPCTPNHPILTPGGWLPAQFVKVGGYVVSSRVREWGTVGHVQHQNVPARFHDVAKAARRAQQMVPRPVPLSAEDFHGDGVGSEIAVVWADRLLGNRVYASGLEHGSERPLSRGDVEPAGLDGDRTLELRREWDPAASRCRVCGRDLSLSPLGTHLRPLESFGRRPVANGHTSSDEPASNRVAVNTVQLGERQLRGASLITAGEFGHREPVDSRAQERYATRRQDSTDGAIRDTELACDLLGGLAGPVLADHVVGVDVCSFGGQVFNLQTSTGAYWAEGIVTHNCRCAFATTEPDR